MRANEPIPEADSQSEYTFESVEEEVEDEIQQREPSSNRMAII